MPCKSTDKRLEYGRRYYREHKDEINAKKREYRRAHPEYRAKDAKRHRQRYKTSEYNAYMRAYYPKTKLQTKRRRDKIKIEVFMHYSNNKMECARCCYNNIDALCIDHVNNNGQYERNVLKLGGGHTFYSWLKNHGFPSGYQVLCYNCNHLKELKYLRNRGKGHLFVQQRI